MPLPMTRSRVRKKTETVANRPWVVLSAFPPEIAWLKAYGRSNAALLDQFLIGTAGIGLVDAAAGASRMLAGLPSGVRPRGIIFVGTAGVAPLQRAPRIQQVVVPERLGLHCHAVSSGRAYLPAIMVKELGAAPELVLRFQRAGVIGVPRVLCPVGITRARAPAGPRPFVENLEAFSVARVAALFDLPFAAVLGISNTIGPHANTEWKANAKAAAEAACKAIVTALFRAPSR